MQAAKKNLSISVNNLQISYNESGPAHKPVLIFIHGFPFNKSIWDFQLETFSENYRVIAYDIRGFGVSESGDQNFSIDVFGEDLIRFMDALGIDKAIVCGHSMGGYIALNAIEKYPARFSALALIDTQSKGDSSEAKEKRVKAIENIRANGVEEYAAESVKNLFAYISFTSKREEIAMVKGMIINTEVSTLEKTLRALADRRDVTSKLGDIHVPVLVMVGKKDTITPPAVSESMHEKIENSTLELIDYAAHLPNLENPREFNRILKKFIDKCTSPVKQNQEERTDYHPYTPGILEMVATKLQFQLGRFSTPFKKYA